MIPTHQLTQEPSIIISPTKNTNKEVFKIIGMILAEKTNTENFFIKENDTLLDAFIKFNKFPMIESLK